MNDLSRSGKVLVIDADYAAGIETMQSLGRHGCIVDAVCLSAEQPHIFPRSVRNRTVLASEDMLVQEIVKLFQKEKYDLIVPVTEIALQSILSHEVPDEIYNRAVLAPRKSIEVALNKEGTWQLARRLNILTPASTLVSSREQVPLSFPVVLKPVLSKAKIDGVFRDLSVTIARNANEWRRAIDSDYLGVSVQQQEYVYGTGLGVELLFERGVPRWTFIHERIHELPMTGGGSSYRASVGQRDDLISSSVALLKELSWHGVAMVEYRIDPSGRAVFMEINPRLWGSLALAVDCGVDFPVGLLWISVGKELPPQPKYRVGYYTRNLSRDVEWFRRNLKADKSDPLLLTRPVVLSALEWLRPLLGKESWDFFSWSDLAVIFDVLKQIVSTHWARLLMRSRLGFWRAYVRFVEQPRKVRSLQNRDVRHVLFLCYGNICRSPLAAGLFASRFPDLLVSSAGFHPESGRPSPAFVLEGAAKLDINLAAHRSQRVTEQMIERSDLILLMDIRNLSLLRKQFPTGLGKAVLLGMCMPNPKLEIEDPYHDPSSMGTIAAQIDCALRGIGRYLRMSRSESQQSGRTICRNVKG